MLDPHTSTINISRDKKKTTWQQTSPPWQSMSIIRKRVIESGISPELLKIVLSWLKDRKAYVVFDNRKSKIIDMNVGLPRGSSLSPYLFIVLHCDLVNYLSAHSAHLFADDLGMLIKPPVTKNLAPMLEYFQKEDSKICQHVYKDSKKWKQPIIYRK